MDLLAQWGGLSNSLAKGTGPGSKEGRSKEKESSTAGPAIPTLGMGKENQ